MKGKLMLRILKYIGSLLLALSIIYFLFQNQDPLELIKEIQQVETEWVILSMIFGGWAIVSRGLRWIILIDTLGYKSSKWNSISAVAIMYFTNLFIPRAGEISRCTSLGQADKIPVNKLFGTILIERVIDFAFLFGLIILTMILKFNDILNFYTALKDQPMESTNDNNLIIALAILIFCIIIFILSKKWLKQSSLYKKAVNFIRGLKEGFKSVNKMKKKKLFWSHTFIIWLMYLLMTYICFFCIEATSDLTVSDGLFILVLGGIGMVIPTPGGIGSYHFLVMIGLSVLGVGWVSITETTGKSNPALLFPTIVHIAQTLVAIIMGSIGLLILFLSKKNSNVTS